MLIQFFLFLFIVILTVLLFLCFLSKHLFDIHQFFVQFLPDFASFSFKYLPKSFLCLVNLISDSPQVVMNLFDILTGTTIKHIGILFLKLFLPHNFLVLFLIVYINPF